MDTSAFLSRPRQSAGPGLDTERMTSAADPARDQLLVELTAQLVDPLTRLTDQALRPTLTAAVEASTGPLIARLRDTSTAATTADEVIAALWTHSAPDDPWWRTPLGLECARALAPRQTGAVTYAKAAAMLGLSRGSIGPMVDRGVLDRDPDGNGVLTASVLRRLTARS